MTDREHKWSALLDQRTHRMEMEYHPRIGHRHVPSITARLPNRRGVAHLSRTNATGFRSDQEFLKERGDRPRILFFGDSYTAGQESDNHERYSEQLGLLLDAEVYNYGLSGSAPDQQLLIYEEFAKDVEADLIIWGVTVHNIERIRMKFRPSTDRMSGKTILMPKPYFVLNGGELELHHVPAPRARNEINTPNTLQFRDSQAEPNFMQRAYRSPAARPLVDLLRKAGLADRLRSMVYRATGVQMYDDYCDSDSDGWQLLAAIIRRFNELASPAPLLVVPLPTYHYVVDRIKPVYDPLFATLENESAGLHVLSLTTDLAKGKSLNDRKALIASHYTAHGHKEIAKLLATRIRELDLIPARSTETAETKTLSIPKSAKHHDVLAIAFDNTDAAAVLVRDGEIFAAGREEHFTQQLGQGGFPSLAINFCLEQAERHARDLAVLATETNLGPAIAERVNFEGEIIEVAPTDDFNDTSAKTPALARALSVAAHACERATNFSTSDCLGPEFSDTEIRALLDMYELPHEHVEPLERAKRIVELLMHGKTVANFAGRFEYGPHPHGGRAVLGDRDDPELAEISEASLKNDPGDVHSILKELESKSGRNSIAYSPLRLPGAPVALTPFDAYRVIMLRGIDALMLGNFLVIREQQPDWPTPQVT